VVLAISDFPHPGTPRINIPFGWGRPYSLALSVKALERCLSHLSCIVANNGGIGEYVNEETGFKIEPISKEYLTQELTSKIKMLVEDDKLRESMSAKAIERAKEFEWDRKAEKIVEIYQKTIGEKARTLTENK
jgi:glycosyltransferase involved in cell wall biosynthesis